MVVETLGDAWAAGWRVTARCAWGKCEGMKTRRECHYTQELDLPALPVRGHARCQVLGRASKRIGDDLG
jgi:hypothetical protein